MTTLTLINQKGGVAKTTTAHALGAGLAQRGNKVLLIDFDGQANLTAIVRAQGNISIAEVMENKYPLKRAIEAVQGTTGLDIVKSSTRLNVVGEKISDNNKLKTLMEPIKGAYDYVVIDSPPSINLLTLNALSVADYAIIPAQADILSLQAIKMIASSIEAIRQAGNSKLKIAGVLITMYDRRPTLHREALEALEERARVYGTKVFDTKIRNNIALAEAQALGKDIFTYKPKSNGAVDYNAFINELLASISK